MKTFDGVDYEDLAVEAEVKFDFLLAVELGRWTAGIAQVRLYSSIMSRE